MSCAALTDDAAVVTATDGKVRAFDLETGEPALELRREGAAVRPAGRGRRRRLRRRPEGVLHAIDLADGAEKWKLDLAADPPSRRPA